MGSMTWAAFLAAAIASSAQADYNWDSPSNESFNVRESPAPDIPPPRAMPERADHPCATFDLGGAAVFEEKLSLLSVTYIVRAADRIVGILESSPRGYDLKDAQRNVIATARAPAKDMAVIADCSGAVIGRFRIERSDGSGGRSFMIEDPSGLPLARTGPIGYLSDPVLFSDARGAPAAEIRSLHWFLGRWELRLPDPTRLDGRIAAMLLAYNNAANREESLRRHRQHRRRGAHRGDRKR